MSFLNKWRKIHRSEVDEDRYREMTGEGESESERDKNWQREMREAEINRDDDGERLMTLMLDDDR